MEILAIFETNEVRTEARKALLDKPKDTKQVWAYAWWVKTDTGNYWEIYAERLASKDEAEGKARRHMTERIAERKWKNPIGHSVTSVSLKEPS